MTMTVKLAPAIEARLREVSAQQGHSASHVMRLALMSYLDSATAAKPSAYELGQTLFGKHGGDKNLASQRKKQAAALWDEKHARRKGA